MSPSAAPVAPPATALAAPARTVVHKFGGTSVADAERYRHVAQLLLARDEATQVTVVSAMKGVTDALIDLAHAAADADAGNPAPAVWASSISASVTPFIAETTVTCSDSSRASNSWATWR